MLLGVLSLGVLDGSCVALLEGDMELTSVGLADGVSESVSSMVEFVSFQRGKGVAEGMSDGSIVVVSLLLVPLSSPTIPVTEGTEEGVSVTTVGLAEGGASVGMPVGLTEGSVDGGTTPEICAFLWLMSVGTLPSDQKSTERICPGSLAW